MSNKVYLIQKGPVVGRLAYPTRQTVIPHVITHAPVVRVIQNTPPQTIHEDAIETEILDFDRPQQKPQRRRERLNHLTQEQKMDRRKMKNREAAQNARDRKKIQTCHMEQKLKQMAAEIRQLRAENAKLRAQVNKQTPQCVPSEYDCQSLSTQAMSESSSSPPSYVEPAAFRESKSLPWIRASTSSSFNRQRTQVNVLKKCTQRRQKFTIKPMKCRPTSNKSLSRRSASGLPSNLLQMLMFLAHNSLNLAPSSQLTSCTTRPANITSNLHKVTSLTRSAVNFQCGTMIHASPKKLQLKELKLCKRRSRIKSVYDIFEIRLLESLLLRTDSKPL